MAKHRRLFAAMIAVSSLVALSSPSAAGPAQRARVLIAQFGEHQSVSEPRASEPQLVTHLEDEWVNWAASADTPAPGGPTADAFLQIPHPHVPAWMRTGKRSASPQIASRFGPINDCGSRPYQPSALLASDAEERRRLFYPLVQRAACDAGLPTGLMDAMLIQESRYNPWATSPKGAFGLGQLMPGTAAQLGVDRYDLRGNLAGAARYLRQHIDEFRQVPLALAAYNAGPARVRKTWTVPRITETQNYVRQILINWRTLESESAPAAMPLAPRTVRRSSLVSSFP